MNTKLKWETNTRGTSADLWRGTKKMPLIRPTQLQFAKEKIIWGKCLFHFLGFVAGLLHQDKFASIDDDGQRCIETTHVRRLFRIFAWGVPVIRMFTKQTEPKFFFVLKGEISFFPLYAWEACFKVGLFFWKNFPREVYFHGRISSKVTSFEQQKTGV